MIQASTYIAKIEQFFETKVWDHIHTIDALVNGIWYILTKAHKPTNLYVARKDIRKLANKT